VVEVNVTGLGFRVKDFAAIMKNLKCHNIDVQQKKTLQLEGQ
jgi:hypothetical protein